MPEMPIDLKYSEACGDIEWVKSVSDLIEPANLMDADAYRDLAGG